MNAALLPFDLETITFRMHMIFVRIFTGLFSLRSRMLMEYLFLANCVFFCGLLVTLHTRFDNQSTCLANSLKNVSLNETHILRIEIAGFWTNLSNEQKNQKYEYPQIKQMEEDLEFSLSNSLLRYAFGDEYVKYLNDEMEAEKTNSDESIDHSLEDNTIPFMFENEWIGDPVYLFSLEKGFLLLSDATRARHGINISNVTISVDDPCFGGSTMQLIIENIVGYDTIIMNNFAKLYKYKGYLRNVQSQELWNFHYAAHFDVNSLPIEDIILLKISVIFSSILVFFISTILVSLTQRELQFRITQLIFELAHSLRNHSSIKRVAASFFIQVVVFMMVTLAVFLTIAEFLNDRTLALMTFCLVWSCELFTTISVRTRVTMSYFPKFFMIFFLLYHIYLFLFPFGFYYVAFMALASVLQYMMYYFFNRCEIPALQDGLVTLANPRIGFIRRPFAIRGRPFNIPQQPANQPQTQQQTNQPNVAPNFPVPPVPGVAGQNIAQFRPFGVFPQAQRGFQFIQSQPTTSPFAMHQHNLIQTPPNFLIPQTQTTETTQNEHDSIQSNLRERTVQPRNNLQE